MRERPPSYDRPHSKYGGAADIYVTETLDNGMEGTIEASFVLELAWRFDRFILNATQVPTVGLGEHMARRIEHRHAVVTKTNNCKVHPANNAARH